MIEAWMRGGSLSRSIGPSGDDASLWPFISRDVNKSLQGKFFKARKPEQCLVPCTDVVPRMTHLVFPTLLPLR